MQAKVFVQERKTNYFAQMDGTAIPSLTLFPAAPTVTSVTGACINDFTNCVTGNNITLYGTNFVTTSPSHNRVNIANLPDASC